MQSIVSRMYVEETLFASRHDSVNFTNVSKPTRRITDSLVKNGGIGPKAQRYCLANGPNLSGQFEEAVKLQGEVLELAREIEGKMHPNTSIRLRLYIGYLRASMRGVCTTRHVC